MEAEAEAWVAVGFSVSASMVTSPHDQAKAHACNHYYNITLRGPVNLALGLYMVVHICKGVVLHYSTWASAQSILYNSVVICVTEIVGATIQLPIHIAATVVQ